VPRGNPRPPMPRCGHAPPNRNFKEPPAVARINRLPVCIAALATGVALASAVLGGGHQKSNGQRMNKRAPRLPNNQLYAIVRKASAVKNSALPILVRVAGGNSAGACAPPCDGNYNNASLPNAFLGNRGTSLIIAGARANELAGLLAMKL
jgi:hypothetical protein